MARTARAATLTARHRELQLQLGASASREFLQLWPLWQGDEPSFWRMVAAAVPIVRRHRTASATLAAQYFAGFRAAERVEGHARAKLAGALDEDQLRAALFVTGADMTSRAVAAGQTPETAMRTALVRTIGTVSRYVYDGGRSTLVTSTLADDHARGWARVTSSKPCAFCAMLASRGPVYREEGTAIFRAHDHCSCMVEPSYEGSAWPAGGREFQRLWNEHAKGENPLNAFRQALAGQAG